MSKTQWVYGLHAANAALKHNPQNILQLYIQAARTDRRIEEIVQQAQQLGLSCQRVSKQLLDKKVSAVHQGVVMTLKVGKGKVGKGSKAELGEAALKQIVSALKRPALLLVLDGVTDPHNLGACLRTADAAGVDAVIVPKDKSVLLNATVRKVACGAAEIVPFVVVTNLARTLAWLKEQGVWLIGTAGEAQKNLYQADLAVSLALVMGSEGKGLRRLTRERCDLLVSVPMAGELSSLNVSVTTGICLYEALRQRQ